VVRATDGDPARVVPMVDEIIASKVNLVLSLVQRRCGRLVLQPDFPLSPLI